MRDFRWGERLANVKKERQDKALLALLNSTTRTEAAKKAGITDNTLRSYLNDPEFRKRYDTARTMALKETTALIQANMQPAAMALVEICRDKKANEQSRVSAARSLLEYGVKLSELTDIYSRIEALENVEDKEDDF